MPICHYHLPTSCFCSWTTVASNFMLDSPPWFNLILFKPIAFPYGCSIIAMKHDFPFSGCLNSVGRIFVWETRIKRILSHLLVQRKGDKKRRIWFEERKAMTLWWHLQLIAHTSYMQPHKTARTWRTIYWNEWECGVGQNWWRKN